MTMTHTYTETGVRTSWVRLELIDPISNNAKYYVVWDNPSTNGFLAAFGRIGGKPQWNADSSKLATTQIAAKSGKGYQKVAEGDGLIPDSWMLAYHTGSVDATVASLRRGIWDATFASVAIDQERPLSDLLERCSKLVSESVANPDAAMHTFAEVIGRVEAAREDCEQIESLVETIQLLLGKGAE